MWALSDLAELPAPDLRKPEIPRIPPGTYPEYAQLRKFGPRVRPDVPPPIPPKPSAPPPRRSPDGEFPDPGLVLSAILGLWWLNRPLLSDLAVDTDDGYAVVGVKAHEFRLDPNAPLTFSERGLSLKETEKYCPDIGLVQGVLNLARDKVGNKEDFIGLDQGAYGKAVDAKFKELLSKLNSLRISRGDTAIFIIDKTFSFDGKDAFKNARWAKTPDALQKRPNNVCAYEVDTEEGSGDDRDNMLAIFVNMSRHESMAGVTNFVMTRVRPSTPPPPPRTAR